MITLIDKTDHNLIDEESPSSLNENNHSPNGDQKCCTQVHTPHSQSKFAQTTLPEITFVDNKQLSKLLENSIHQEEESGKHPSTSHVSYELIIESQSGLSLFGYNLFSSLFIPAKFQSINEKNYTDLKNIPFNDLNSSWIWKNWYIVMFDDVDDKGWCYSYKLSAKNWSGKFKFKGLRFFRRRLWMRLKLVNDAIQISQIPLENDHSSSKNEMSKS